MSIIRPDFFSQFPEIVCGISTRYGAKNNPPFENNMSFSIGDSPERVTANRNLFFKQLGLTSEQVAWQSQVHGIEVCEVNSSGNCGESDALYTSEANLGIAISIADCTPVLVYLPKAGIVCGIHAGWRGTALGIVRNTLVKLMGKTGNTPEQVFVYIGPAIQQRNYEVGEDTASFFTEADILHKENNLYLDVSGANYHQVLELGIPTKNCYRSPICTFEEPVLCHSFRRDKEKSGRSLALIYRKQ